MATESSHEQLPQTIINPPTDFKTEHHPRSKCPTLFQNADNFRLDKSFKPPPDHAPWRPFRCKGDFEFAEIALDEKQVNDLLDLIACVAKGTTQVTLKNEQELRKACDAAATELTPVHARSIWQWVLDLLNNPHIAPHFIWDAECLYKHNGVKFERFYDEPWTADSWWDIQSELPASAENAVPLALILYANKSKLSSFGTVKGYPVVVRCGNLPVNIRNSADIGGGTVVPEDAAEEGKLGYTTLKRVVWHDSFLKLLSKVAQHSTTGYAHTCYDKILRWLFPLILILSADYEEQCMMSLIRGRSGKCPCPVCLVPLEELHDLSKSFPLRSQTEAQEALTAWEENQARGEAILKKLGLRPVENVFWIVLFSDPHKALSFDRLHALHLGLWGKHILGELKKILAFLGQEAEAEVERYVTDFPSWRNLSHFNAVVNITFNDGNKMRDLAKQVFYVLLNVLKKNTVPEGYILLRMLQTYLELDGLIFLDVHTETTLSMIEKELPQFNDALNEYIELAMKSNIEGLRVDWDFPKVHAWKHIVNDIRHKGAARNFSTRPNESMHGALREAYKRWSNGREVASQVLQVDHHMLAVKLLRLRITSQEFVYDQDQDPEMATSIDNEHDAEGSVSIQHTQLGAPCRLSITMQSLETCNATDGAFRGIRRKFAEFLNSSVNAWGYNVTKYIMISPAFEITEHRYLRVNYSSTVDWRENTDYLRCNPKFFGKPRYNCALIQLTATEVAFVRLIFMFTCYIPDLDGTFEFALVQPYSRRTGPTRQLDRDLKLICVKASPWSSSMFIPVASIVRGAVLAPDSRNREEAFVVSYLDDDTFLHTKATNSGLLQDLD
ncbi:hypothetical protein PAXINDRAFT_164338 [Paxillus involutus ATCC 200175]|uniref:Uncharacterized protein n=1 Tax=Paxillus involutus ATCC 200175 TaxID=664439 RepID=A0A0C9TQ36_PAXIN|nr:hypothetical protein PAXINDRAFT_164338 [Paxillus involutus ATCC 200175]